MGIRLKLTLLLLTLFIAAIGNTFLNFQIESNGETKLKWVNHTNEVLIEAERFLSYLKDAETGQRGFIITSDVSYLVPFHQGVTNAEKSYKTLLSLTADNSSQQDKLNTIGKNMELKFKELNETINLMKSSRDKAIKLVSQDIGKQYMDNIRTHVDQFISQEKILLEKRKGDLRENRGIMFTVIIIEITFFLFLALITIFYISKNLFAPLKTLLINTKKMEEGKDIKISDILANDEMGYLLSCFYMMYEKVSEHTKMLSHKATHDELTGLQNRVTLIDTLNTQINESAFNNKKLGILFIDLNKFKYINDTYGHEVGDAVLIEASTRLKKTIRNEDSIFRLGGDEFVIVIKNLSSSSHIKTVISKILKSFQENLDIDNIDLKVSLSIGAAIAPDDSEDPDELIKMADLAMYLAKKEKEDNYKFFEKSMFKRLDDKP